MSTNNGVIDIGTLSSSSNDDDASSPNNTKVANQRSPPKTTKCKGRPVGAKKWTELEIDNLLDTIEDKLPTGAKHWEEVAQKLYEECGYNRNKNACQQKFFRLADVDKPTGSTFIPRHVARAKDIKEQIDAQEVVGLVARNNSSTSSDEDFEEDENPRDTALKGSRLMDDDGNLRRPKTKKQKTTEVADMIVDLAAEHNKGTAMVCSALNSMATAIAQKSSRGVEDLRDQVAGLESKLDLLLDKLT